MTLFEKIKVKGLRSYQRNTYVNKKLWEAKKPYIQINNDIKQQEKDMKEAALRVSWSKLLLIFLFINFTILEFFIGWVTIKCLTLAIALGTAPDFTPLVTLVGAVMGQTISYGIYAAKSKAENTKNGLVYDLAMLEKQDELNSNEGGVG